MARWSGRRKSPGVPQKVQGYTLRGRTGRINDVGVSNDPYRRTAEHQMAGKRGRLKVETPAMSRSEARQWEAGRLAAYRRNHSGKNPRYNKTKSGGWKS